MRVCLFAGLWIALATSFCAAADPQPTPEQLKFFETKIRPLLAHHCYECHGPDEQTSNLRLDTWAGMVRGGDSGPAILAGRPAGSLLITAVGYRDNDLRMPPDKKLSDRQIADLTAWVKMGAPHPDAGTVPAPRPNNYVDLEQGREFWSFRPPADPPLPAVEAANWPTSPLDHFILSALEEQGLKPAPPADKRTLIRRATFDLTGLPPTPAEIDAFLADDSPEAFARVVDRLLASPHYGERWGRHWLDVARYADSNGLDENIAHGNAWRYRDYVIAAFNNDKPYDQFLTEQLAGDLLPETGDPAVRHERLIATGFLSLGPKVLAEVDETKMEMDIVDEQVDTVARAFMALTFGCARCHDHKFDPIPTDDYYGLAGVFKSTKTMEHFRKIARWHENPIPSAADLAAQAAHDEQVAEQKAAIERFVMKADEQAKASLEPGADPPEKLETLYPEETQAELKKLRDALAELEKNAPNIPTAMGVAEAEVMDVAVHIRGSHLTLGDEVPRRFPQVVAGSDQPPLPADQSGRLQLAQWLLEPGHPLTGRVMVNRIWRWHFGRGLSRTPDNFGRLGEAPTHPELLDWLAHRFVENGWSMKSLHRLIMLSSTYQMSSEFNAHAYQRDPENRLYWRAGVRRLEAETIRDALLAVGGLLELEMGGSMLHVGNREFFFDHTSKDGTKYDSQRRSVYLPVVRNNLFDMFQLFDFADASVLNGDRPSTVVAPQALFMLNGDLVMQAAESLAAKLLDDSESSNTGDAQRIAALYLKSYGRSPSERETAQCLAFLDEFEQAIAAQTAQPDSPPTNSRRQAWISLCHTILASNEFIYLR